MEWVDDEEVKRYNTPALLSDFMDKRIPLYSLFCYVDTEAEFCYTDTGSDNEKMFFGVCIPCEGDYDCITFSFLTQCGMEHTQADPLEGWMDPIFYDIFFRKDNNGNYVTKVIKTFDNCLDTLNALVEAHRDGFKVLQEL